MLFLKKIPRIKEFNNLFGTGSKCLNILESQELKHKILNIKCVASSVLDNDTLLDGDEIYTYLKMKFIPHSIVNSTSGGKRINLRKRKIKFDTGEILFYTPYFKRSTNGYQEGAFDIGGEGKYLLKAEQLAFQLSKTSALTNFDRITIAVGNNCRVVLGEKDTLLII